MNTFYGQAGNLISPLYNLLVASSITYTGGMLIKQVSSFAEQRNFKVWYGDTDSVFLSLRDFDGSDWASMINQTISRCKELRAEIN
jgi:DNA polymerase elongation subunit (family B)